MIQVARIHSRPLDRSRPLWEVYVIEGLDRIPGLPKGCFAIFMKLHHASIDGQAGVELLRAVHSLAPDADESLDEGSAVYAERDPTTIELYTRAVSHSVGRATGISRLYASTLGKIAGATIGEVSRRFWPGADGEAAESLPGFTRAPVTRFNRTVSANRVVEAVALPLDRMQAARRKVDDATINDLFLAVVGGALSRYLASKDELPEASLIALMPVSTRDEARAGVLGNDVGGVPVPVHSEIADPIKRLRAIHAGVRAAKQSMDALGHGFAMEVLNEFPHAVAEAVLNFYLLPQLNVTVSNIRGPEAALYVAGARLLHFYPVSIATDYVGLNHTGFSYNGVLWISAVACRNMMPDPGFYADCLRASFEELMAAIDALPEAVRIGPAARPATGPSPRKLRSSAAPAGAAKATPRRRSAGKAARTKPAARRRNGG
jgi:diacylglycerol O-acyltransferase / wax synthase